MPVQVPETAITTRIVIDRESDQGVVKGTPKGRKIACLETVKKTKGLEDVDEVRSDPNPQDPVPGDVNVAGDITTAPNIKNVMMFLGLFCNHFPAATGVGPYLYKPLLTGGKMGTFRMEKGYTTLSTPQYEMYTGLAIKSISADWKATGLLKHRYGVIGMDSAAPSGTPYDASVDDWESGAKFHHAMIAAAGMKIGGSAVTYVLDGSFTCDRVILSDDRPVGAAGALASLPTGKVMCSGRIRFKFNDLAVLTVLQAGTPSSIELKWTYSASPAYYLLHRWNRVYFQYTSPTKGKDGLLELEAEWKAAYDATDVTAFYNEVSTSEADAEYV